MVTTLFFIKKNTINQQEQIVQSAKEILEGMPLQSQINKYKEKTMQQNKLQKTMNATIVTGEYTDRQTGQLKKSYLTIGKLFIYNDGGMSLKLDAMPTGNQNISFYDIKPKQQPNNSYGQGQQPQGQNQNRYN